MSLPSLAVHPSLASASRARAVASRLGASPIVAPAVLLALGVLASYLTLTVDLDLHIPGHSILRAVVPLPVGLGILGAEVANGRAQVVVHGGPVSESGKAAT